jgi:hypothetical protein
MATSGSFAMASRAKVAQQIVGSADAVDNLRANVPGHQNSAGIRAALANQATPLASPALRGHVSSSTGVAPASRIQYQHPARRCDPLRSGLK